MNPLDVIGAAVVMRLWYDIGRKTCRPEITHCVGFCKHVAEKRGKQWWLAQLSHRAADTVTP